MSNYMDVFDIAFFLCPKLVMDIPLINIQTKKAPQDEGQ